MPTPNFNIRILSAIAIVLLSASTPRAQIINVTNNTSTPIPGAGHDYIKMLAETVNPANGALSLRINLQPPLGRQLNLPFFVSHDSNGVHFPSTNTSASPSLTWHTSFSDISQGGWSYTLPLASSIQISRQGVGRNPPTCSIETGYVFQDPTGGRHALGIAAVELIQGCPSSRLSGGDDLFRAALTASSNLTVAGADGSVFALGGLAAFGGTGICTGGVSGTATTCLPAFIEDRNGNKLTITAGKNAQGALDLGIFTVSDTLGRTAVSSSGFGATGNTLTVSGLASPVSMTWGSASSNFAVNATAVLTNQYCRLTLSDSETQPVLTAITLPNGKQYQFNYDPTYGELSKITYPSGGYVSYVWGLNTQSDIFMFPANVGGSATACQYILDIPAVLHRYVSFDGSNVALQQDFSYTTTWSGSSWTSKQTTVTTHDFVRGTTFQTVYTYGWVYGPPVPPYVPTNETSQIPVEQSVVYEDTTGSTLRTVTKSWYDQYELKNQQTTLNNGQTSQTSFTYGGGAQITEQDDYDFGNGAPGPLLRKTVTSYQVFNTTPIYPAAPSIFNGPCQTIVYDSGGTRVAETDYFYDGNAGTTPCSTTTQTLPGTGSYTGHDETLYGTGAAVSRGNLTKVIKQCFQGATACSSGNPTTTYTYDETGQTLTMVDPIGNGAGGNPSQHRTTYSYTDSYSSGTPPNPTNAYLTTVTHPQTSGINHIEKFAYAYASGELTSSTDQNNLVTTYKYNDPGNLARLTETDFPDGGVTSIAYNDSPYNPSTPSPSVTTTKEINGSTNLVTVSATDGLGHILNNLVTSDPQGTIHVDTAYDGLARIYTLSNPYRSGTDPTTSSGTTTYIYDALGRKCVEVPPDGTAVSSNACPASAPAKDLFTQYSGSITTVTDQTGKKRQSTTDGLGRLTQVVEDPGGRGYITNYAIDTLGNLKQVVQNGSHTRTFTYDSLSRLLTSNNPEVGTITYKYDSDTSCPGSNSFPSLLVSKTDARGIRACAQYDALNRETVHNYSNGDATITTVYDGSSCLGLAACQNIGHATSITDGAGSESWAYQTDSANLRSVHVNQRTTTSSPSNITKTSTYYFDLAANLYSITYPTGRIVNYTYNAANRPVTAADSANGITYAAAQSTPPTGCLSSGVCYTPQGTEFSAAIGKTSTFNGINLSETYNSRLQPLEIKASSTGGNAFDITYSFVDPASGGNAGHVNSITNILDTTRSQTFGYDQLNRITGALTASTYATSPAHCWGESYTVDPWGNLNSIAVTTTSGYTGCTEESGFSTTADGNNHLPLFGYDTSGNTQSDGSISYSYDAESQIKTANGVTYLYDGAGRRVSKSNGKLYWYGSGGEILAETNAAGNTLNEYVFFGGKRIAMLPAGGNAQYYVEDLLGTSRVMTTNTGTLCYDGDFYPYGGERTYTNSCPTGNNYKFEGKERDTETGNDDFGARYYSNRFGHWLSADWSNVPVPVPYANLTNPQTLNLYAMVSDDPESSADLDGHGDDSVFDGIMRYVQLMWSGFSPAAEQSRRSSGQVLDHNGMTLGDVMRTSGEANKEAASQVQNLTEAIDPTGVAATAIGRDLGLRTNSDVALSLAGLGLDVGVANAISGARNILTNRFTKATFDAAAKEAKGIVVALRPDGKPFDHIGALKQGLNGLINDAITLTRALKNKDLSAAQRSALQRNLKMINNAINDTRYFFLKNNIDY
jgi:RHS repeat-associated protein